MPQRFLQYMANWFGSVRLDFGGEPHQRHLTLTFNFLSGILGLLVLLTAVWSIAAGVLQSGRLIANYHSIFQNTVLDVGWMQGAALLPAAVIYTLKAFGVSMLVCLSAASIGAIIGFLFGVPRPISESGLQPSQSNGSSVVTAPQSTDRAAPPESGPTGAAAVTPPPPPTLSAASSAVPGWQASTNLTQISDWLTKIIVGVGLVEAHRITEVAGNINTFVSSQLFEGLVGTQLVLPALMLAGLIFGFLYSYLFTQLFLAAMMAYSAAEVGHANEIILNRADAAVLSGISAGNAILAPPMRGTSGRAHRDPPAEASESQKNAARNVQSVPLDQVSDPASIKVWARAQAIMDNWEPAVSGYTKLLTMWRTPEVLSEAARVFASAKDPKTARTLIDEAVRGRDATAADSRSRITFDAANVALYDDPPGGYTRALSLLDDETLRTDDQGGLHILRACANGQRLLNEGKDLNDDAKARIRQLVLDDLRRGIELSPKRNIPWVVHLLDASNDMDNDFKLFREDPDFLALVA